MAQGIPTEALDTLPGTGGLTADDFVVARRVGDARNYKVPGPRLSFDERGPNDRLDGFKKVSYYSPATPGYQPGESTLTELTGLILGGIIDVEFGADPYRSRYRLVFDAQGPLRAQKDGRNTGVLLPASAVLETDKRAGVPAYDELQLNAPAGGYVFAVGDLVRDYAGGSVEKFFAALGAGPLPAPTAPEGDANWRLVGDEEVPEPIPEPFDFVRTLSQAQSAAVAGQIKLNRQYRILGGDVATSLDVLTHGLNRYGYEPQAYRATPNPSTGRETYEVGTYAVATGVFTPNPALGPDSVKLPLLAAELRALLELNNAQLITVPAGRPNVQVTLNERVNGSYRAQEIPVLNGTIDRIDNLTSDSTVWLAGQTASFELVAATYQFFVTPVNGALPVHVLPRRVAEGAILYGGLGSATDGAMTQEATTQAFDEAIITARESYYLEATYDLIGDLTITPANLGFYQGKTILNYGSLPRTLTLAASPQVGTVLHVRQQAGAGQVSIATTGGLVLIAAGGGLSTTGAGSTLRLVSGVNSWYVLTPYADSTAGVTPAEVDAQIQSTLENPAQPFLFVDMTTEGALNSSTTGTTALISRASFVCDAGTYSVALPTGLGCYLSIRANGSNTAPVVLNFTLGTLNGLAQLTLQPGEWRLIRKPAGTGRAYVTVWTGGPTSGPTRDPYDVPPAVRDAVVAGTFTNGELDGPQPAGSLAAMTFTTTTHGYTYQRGAAGALAWNRFVKG